MISYLFYDIRVAQERLSYDIIYDIMAFFMISHMILHMKLASKPWYHVWYHIIYDFIYDIINDTYLKSCMISYMILYMISTENLWCHVWYHSKYDIIYDVIHDIMMAWLTCHSLQPPIVPRHSVLKQAMLIMIQEAVAAGDLPPLDADAANVFSRSKLILQDHARRCP